MVHRSRESERLMRGGCVPIDRFRITPKKNSTPRPLLSGDVFTKACARCARFARAPAHEAAPALRRAPRAAPPKSLRCRTALAHAMSSANAPGGSASARSASQLMPPPPSRVAGATTLSRRPPQQRVLDEDEWTMCLEDIVERDYFPDLPRLKNRLDWLEATRSGDPEQIRAAQLRIQARGVARLCARGDAQHTPAAACSARAARKHVQLRRAGR
jgi:hypothetical protein